MSGLLEMPRMMQSPSVALVSVKEDETARLYEHGSVEDVQEGFKQFPSHSVLRLTGAKSR